ncbi:MAG: hypothetical protein OHK0011_01010 [Turneriella sp.]
MKERPILFSGPMVRAILEGRKTQTRRVIKPQPWEEYSAESIKCEHYTSCIVDRYGDIDAGPEIFGAYSTDGQWGVQCPYGQPGDRLWVREAFYIKENAQTKAVWYRAESHCEFKPKWRPSIHMPRWASRITLEITGVRVERLQEISTEDVYAEGMPKRQEIRSDAGVHRASTSAWYRHLWEEINGEESWAANPWVWVIEFKYLKP